MYINTQTNKYPLSEADIKAAFPNTSFPSPFKAPEEYSVVFSSSLPAFDAITHSVREIQPELTNKGTWEQRWEVIALDADVVAANQAATTKTLQENIVRQTQQRLDDFAKTRNYDGILSACTYATSTIPKFQTEGQFCVEARDNTWATLYQILADVQAGTRPVPAGYSDIEAELPVLAWPN